VQAACSVLFARAVQFVWTGAPARLSALPRRLAYAELLIDGLAAGSGFWVWAWSQARQHPSSRAAVAARRLNIFCVAAMFVLHAIRMAIYVSPGQGRQHQGAAHNRGPEGRDPRPEEVAAGVYRVSVYGSNVYFVRSVSSCVLLDAAWANCGRRIRRAAAAIFGWNSRPAAIVLTHVHPDHVGSALELAHTWDCPVYVPSDELALAVARDLETLEQYANPLDRWIVLPLLRALGRRRIASMLSQTSLEEVCQPFDPRTGVPVLPDWTCVQTPGHSPGHVAFFRASDRVLIAGDAVLTVDVNSLRGWLAWAGCSQPRVFGAPRYTNWDQSATDESVGVLASLEPRVLATGHGLPMAGGAVAHGLRAFAERLLGGRRFALRHIHSGAARNSSLPADRGWGPVTVC
jgi:glyoxylase-like metal-dependent hydrolase (beta-lactamase superfamily II)